MMSAAGETNRKGESMALTWTIDRLLYTSRPNYIQQQKHNDKQILAIFVSGFGNIFVRARV